MSTAQPHSEQLSGQDGVAEDLHSYSNPHHVTTRHLHLELDVDFQREVLFGHAILSLDRKVPSRSLILDTMDLDITKIEVANDESDYVATTFSIGSRDPIIGSPLAIDLGDRVDRVRIEYSTTPGATALQWLRSPQTAGKRHPFMFTQSQPINARSWIPLQDSPQVRLTYSARIRTPPDLLAVMGAANNPSELGGGEYQFEMLQPIPSYLIALAVGDLVFRPLGPRTGVYAEPSVVERAAVEFSDTEHMMKATEVLYGQYRWDRYDILVLPPSFPLGGMENPRLTFLTPTILAGDKSLVSIVAHELAHSWSGNLVTNATWRDFWLNEGFTTYVERRIVEELYGRAREEMEATLARANLVEEMVNLDANAQTLHMDLKGRHPDEGSTRVPYDKGALFLRQIEEVFGRPLFDRFLRAYFERFAFKSMTTEGFVAWLKQELLDRDVQRANLIPLQEWLYEPGLPVSAPNPRSDAFLRVEEQAEDWLRGVLAAKELKGGEWTTHEWLHFLKYLPKHLDQARIRQLDREFDLTNVGNSEIAHEWLLMAIRSSYGAAYPRLTNYLQSIGREKLVKPLYEELIKSDEGRARASAIYQVARPTYHPIVITKIDKLLNGST